MIKTLKMYGTDPSVGPGQMIQVDQMTAMQLMKSMMEQIMNNSPNAGRIEFVDDQGKYFCIAVMPRNP